MKISNPSKAGSLESNDILIMLYPADTIEINIESIVKKQFGKQIENVIRKTLEEAGVTGAKLDVQDKGALDFTIKARVKTALERSMEA